MSVSLLLPQSPEDGNHRIQCPGDVLQERNMGKHRQKIKHFKASYLIILGHAGSNAQQIVKHGKKTIGLKPCFRPFLVNQSRSFPCKGDREGENVPLHFTPSLPVVPVSRLFKAPRMRGCRALNIFPLLNESPCLKLTWHRCCSVQRSCAADI